MTDDQLDRVYRNYFDREMPAELPPLRLNEPVRAADYSPPRRMALAASIAALFLLGLWLSSSAVPSRPAGTPTHFLNDSTADGKKLLDASPEPKP